MPRKTIPLNDSNWRLGSVPQKPFRDTNDLSEVSDWLAATIPGDVRLDLLRAQKIPDPFFGMNNIESQWVDSRDWWYVRDLDFKLEEAERAFLIFDGIDYQSAVFFNGQPLGRHAGMFSQQIYELPTFPISNFQSLIAVRVWGSDALPQSKLSPAQKTWARLIAPLFTPPNQPFPYRYATLKCQMQFGWDFAPCLRTCGIWDDAQIVVARSVFIKNAWVKSPTGRIQVTLALDSDRAQKVHTICTVKGKNFSTAAQSFEFDLQLQGGQQTREVEFELQNPSEWNTWDRGDPNLYELEIDIATPPVPSPYPGEAHGKVLDSLTISFGIRSFQLEQRGAQKDPWTFILNGKREFIRGANWVPLDAIPGRLTRADYAARLQQARDANINFLRVWGGGLREKRAFYDRCDELGILVWQEFPFAGAVLDRFPHDRSFLDFVRVECSAIVRALRHHPSLVVWCGGNEFNPRGNRAIVETLRAVVAEEDGARPFKPASPYRDESHNWRVWHRLANLRDYKKDASPFLSEFGLQAAPNIESLEKFLPREKLLPPNAAWEYHHAELKKLERYARVYSSPPLDKEREWKGFVSATQRAQAHALQIAIEQLRRRKAEEAAGVAIWQLNDAWPSISWSVIDYYGVPKLAYLAVKRAYSPVLASFEYELKERKPGELAMGSLWIINDLRSSFMNAQLTARLNGTEIISQRVNVESDSAVRLVPLGVTLGEGENNLQLQLTWGPAPLCINEYDLNYCDVGEINPLVAAYVTLGNWLMR